MDIFEYLPQLIVAYDGDDEFANLIHVKKADKEKDYLCPCCGGIVKPRALDSTKEQSHYYHKTGKCTKESQLHFFCKNWLFEEGSKFYIDGKLFEVETIDIEKEHHTSFGNYKPDVTVYTTDGKIIFFEMFFTNRKTGDDYFCKWSELENDVVEVDIKGYMFKTDATTIPSFTYLYHEGVCYSKPYIKRDLYANTIAKIKHELTRQKVLNYKARIEQLDWFWQEIRNNSRETILEIISKMEYADMVSCYEIIKKKQCVSYLKNDILEIINQKVISDVRNTLGLPYDENIYFDLECIQGRTYEAGIRLNIKTEHINYNKLFSYCDNYWNEFEKLKGFPKIVFRKNIFTYEELIIPDKENNRLKNCYNDVLERKEEILKHEENLTAYEENKYKIKMITDYYTVLIKNNDKFDVLLDHCWVSNPFNIQELAMEIDNKISDIENDKFLEYLVKSDEYNLFLSSIKEYSNSNIDIRLDIKKYKTQGSSKIKFKLYLCNKCVYEEELKKEIDDFILHRDNCESLIQNFKDSYSIVLSLVEQINTSKNGFWKAKFDFNYYGYPAIKIDQKYFSPRKYTTFERIGLSNLESCNKQDIVRQIEKGMKSVLKNMERCGYRVMEVD